MHELRFHRVPLELGDWIADFYLTVLDDVGVDAAASLARAFFGGGPFARMAAETAGELGAAGMGQRRYLHHHVAELDARARRQVVLRDVEIDEELVASFSPARFVASEQLGDARVHQRDLRFNLVAMPPKPIVAQQTGLGAEGSALQGLALVGRWSANDQFHPAIVLWRRVDIAPTRLQIFDC